MAVSKIISNNEKYLRDALSTGINREAVNSTLDDMIQKSNQIGNTPKQAKEVVESIVEMKKNTENILDESYASNFVRENNAKIKSAINDGISSEEIARTLVASAKKTNTKNEKRHLKFITKLISKMKVKELSLKRQKENENKEVEMQKGRQKVFFK